MLDLPGLADQPDTFTRPIAAPDGFGPNDERIPGAPMKPRLPWLFVVLLVALVVKLASVAIALENRIYASEIGVCYEPVNYTKDPEARERREECLLRTRSRSDLWNLYYALTTR